jgi:Uma2 family endonuclease
MVSNEARMNVQLNLRMDRPAFLAWVQEREERYELERGRVMMMTGGSRRHAIITRRLAAALEKCLDGNQWTVLTSDFGVDLGADTVRYPDVVVDVASGAPEDLTASAPVLVAEVLSPSSATYDLGDKAADYLKSTTLLAYLVLAQDEAKAWVWVRGTSGFSPGPAVIGGPNATIRVAALGVIIDLAEIYADISG